MEMSKINDDEVLEVNLPAAASQAPIFAGAVPEYLSHGLDPLHDFCEEVEALQEILQDIEAIGGTEVGKKVRQLMVELDAFEPSVTMIGQIKSGKTTLVNAMSGHPDLLPADVNPWTSVVTSLHLNTPRDPGDPGAIFRFFDRDEWDHLVENGGRIGELSARAGADQELQKLREQVAKMREKTRERLGKRFELLLGQTHDYGEIDDGLIKRYVCMGDDFDEMSREEQQGQFADITKSADLFLQAPGLPMPLCIRDTPGVNDTFMMREQITIRALRDSKTCVVVLSAHQALSSTDMGLIRLISNVKSRQVIIFVNRIDELPDPAAQVPEIRASLVDTLARNDGPEGAAIIFGSAYWANAVLTQGVDDMVDDSAAALQSYAADQLGADAADMDVADMVWTLSGLPALYHAISERVVESSGARILSTIRKRAANYVAGLRASSTIVSLRTGDGDVQKMSNDEVAALLDGIRKRMVAELDTKLDAVFSKFSERVDQVHDRFLERALESLLQHLETEGQDKIWNYSADGLRMLMRTSYQVMRRNFTNSCDDCYSSAALELTTAYGRIFDVQAENFQVEAPAAPETPPPVTLAQTIALDLKTSWWKGWWGRRRGYRAFAQGFHELIEAETAPMVNELKIEQAREIREMAQARLEEFLSEQRGVLWDICEKAQISLEELHGLFGVSAQEEREQLFDLIFEELDIDDISTGDDDQ
ncbi:dynamin family protein [Jannaschia pohangensis]|uniref:Dynamin family protein n=1 Tax=Jannaschia pohangensis TaxID=390807 RepID=A0A1I3V4M5_9RHOB|nr:dynamin family protein [Jannaschia pohangensis]SFJ89061.1 Dynamin family protein [Jannaschia pohangensis]